MVFNSVCKMLLFHFFGWRREKNSVTLLDVKENKTLGQGCLGHSRSLVVYSELEFLLSWLFRGPVCTGKDVQEAPLLILPQTSTEFPALLSLQGRCGTGRLLLHRAGAEGCCKGGCLHCGV